MKGLDVEEAYKEHKRLIYHICRRFKNIAKSAGVEYEELFQIAAEGFTKAVKRFDPSLSKFSTYVGKSIEGEILRYLRDQSASVNGRITRNVLNAVMKIRKNNWESLSEIELNKRIRVPISDIKTALAYINSGTRTTLYRVFSEDESLTLEDVIGNEDDFSMIYVKEFISLLDEREQVILDGLIFGLSQRKIAEEIGVRQPQVSRIHKNKIKPKLHAYLGGVANG